MYKFVFKSITGAVEYTSANSYDTVLKAQKAGISLSKYAKAKGRFTKGNYIDVV